MVNVNEVHLKKSSLVVIPLAFGLILVATALIPMPVSIEQKEMQTEPYLFYNGTAHPSRLEPSQGGPLTIYFNGIPNSTIFQIEINCDAPILLKFFDLNNLPLNETRDFLMQIEVNAGNSTYYWTPIYEKAAPRYYQNYFIEITAPERTVLVRATVTRFFDQEVTVKNIVYKPFLEPYFGYLGLALIVIAIVSRAL